MKLPAGFKNWKSDHIICRDEAEALVSALKQTADIILSNKSAFWDHRWDYAVRFTWATSCHVSTGYRTEKDAFYLNLQRRTWNHAWDMDVSVVEAVLGLWVMALALDPKGRTYGYDLATNSISKKIAKTSNQRIISSSPELEDAGLIRRGMGSQELNAFWLGNEPIGKVDWSQNLKISFESVREASTRHGHSYDIWIPEWTNGQTTRLKPRKDPGPAAPDLDANEEDEKRKTFRFFGWNACVKETEKIHLSAIPTDSSLTTLCAQELYASFMIAAMSILDCRESIVSIISEGRTFRIEHELLDKLFGAFVNSGLGSRRDAVLCIMPAINSTSEVTPDPVHFLQLVHRKARQLRRERDWKQAASFFQWAHGFPGYVWPATDESFLYKRISHLRGEFYRQAVSENPLDSELFKIWITYAA